MTDTDGENKPPSDNAPNANERLVLPLLIPVIAFLFSILIIYGLSRIFLELNTIKIGDVTMATPFAISVSLFILFAAWYLASNRKVHMWQTASLGLLAVIVITGGAIWAAVDDRGEGDEAHAANGETTPEVTAEAGQVLVDLTESDWVVSATPDSSAPGEITFSVSNVGSILHNLRVVRSELPPESLPLDETGLSVDEDQVDVVTETDDLLPDEAAETAAALEAGNYVLICNIAGHYDAGMFTAFTVQ